MWKTLIGCIVFVVSFTGLAVVNIWSGITGFMPGYLIGLCCLLCAGHEVLRTWKSLRTLKS